MSTTLYANPAAKVSVQELLVFALSNGAGIFHYTPGWRSTPETWAVSTEQAIVENVTFCDGHFACTCGATSVCEHVVFVKWGRADEDIQELAFEGCPELRVAAATPINNWWMRLDVKEQVAA